jgi:hypothetical protein
MIILNGSPFKIHRVLFHLQHFPHLDNKTFAKVAQSAGGMGELLVAGGAHVQIV